MPCLRRAIHAEDDDEWPCLVCGEPFMLKTTTSGHALFAASRSDDDEWPSLVCGEPFMLKTTTSGHALFAASHSEAADPAKVGSSVRYVTTGRIMTAPRVADFMFATIASLIVGERVDMQQIRRTLHSVPFISPMIPTGRRGWKILCLP